MNSGSRAAWARMAGVAGAVWLLAASASAQGPHRPSGGRGADGGPRRMMPAESRPEPRIEPTSQHDAAAPGGGRLSPEERRQLRRDVHEAGRDLYSERMPSGRRDPRRQ